MRHTSALLRRAAVLAAALFLGMVAAPTAALAHHPQPEPQRFYADSGDRCPYGLTEGTLSWRYVHPPEPAAVDVQGVVVDRPVANEIACRDDGYYTVANFVAYASGRPVDKATQRADNARREFRFALAYWGAIERVVIQVCRISGTEGGRSYCGEPQEYNP